MTRKIAFQGKLGAYSHEACQEARPDMTPLPCRSFEDVIEAVRSHQADLGMLPVENSTYGRVADIHRLLPDSGLHIIGETLTRVQISLMALPGVPLSAITQALAHPVLLPQARCFLSDHAIAPVSTVDSAGAAADLTQSQNRERGVLASALAAEIYGLDILAKNIEDYGHNTTRFLHMARALDFTRRGSGSMMTTFVFQVRNIPAALYKAMGGFATNGVNMTKLESYMVGGSFQATQFYVDIQGHPEDESVQLALEELTYFTSELKILGAYPADTAR